ncbi:hypothetical protein [Agrobacterium sp. NPDC089420]|uniref:hypothetical protein n=1 Tax=Agrobacterium sp. NPDC089420 TaxID=3363918 RepID=UPI00384B0B3D
MVKTLGCRFVGHCLGRRQKTERSRCSSAPLRPFDTASLMPEQRQLSGMVPQFFKGCHRRTQMNSAQFLPEQTGWSRCFIRDAGELSPGAGEAA